MGGFVLFEEVISIQDNFQRLRLNSMTILKVELSDDSFSSEGQQNFYTF